MADIVNEEIRYCDCQSCGTSALIRDWSCGCRTVTVINDRRRRAECTVFGDLEHQCLFNSGDCQSLGQGPKPPSKLLESGESKWSYDTEGVGHGSPNSRGSSFSGCFWIAALFIGAIFLLGGPAEFVKIAFPSSACKAGMISKAECQRPPVGSLARAQYDAAHSAPARRTVAASGKPIADTHVAEQCGRAPYNSMIMPPSPPDWTEWFEVPKGCAVHLEQQDVIGRTVRAQCRSSDGSIGSCRKYSAVRFQKYQAGWSAPDLISFTMVARNASDRPSWDAPPTDLSKQ